MSRRFLKAFLDEKGDLSLEDLENIRGMNGLKQLCSSQKKNFVVSVEGNIGCGKSTLLTYFQNYSDTVEAIKEPVELWTNIKGHNGLQLMYDNPERWSFTFNKYCMLTRLQAHLKKSSTPVKMLERSLFSTRHVFVENSFNCGILGAVEHSILLDWFNFVLSIQNVSVDLFVYLRASPEICYERIKKRKRKEEADVPFSFIKELHDLHEDWLMSSDSERLPGPVLVLDASLELPQMEQVYESCKSQILCGC